LTFDVEGFISYCKDQEDASLFSPSILFIYFE